MDFDSAARVDLAQYEALIVEENRSFLHEDYLHRISDISRNLQSGIEDLATVMESFSTNTFVEGLPLSV